MSTSPPHAAPYAPSAEEQKLREARGPISLPFVGDVPAIRARGLIPFLEEGFRRHGDPFRIALGPVKALVVVHPELVEHVLVRRAKNYVKGRGYSEFRCIVGGGLVTAEGEDWRRQRRLLAPTFHERAVEAWIAPMRDEIEEAKAIFSKAAELGTPIDAQEEMARLSMGIVTRTALGLAIGSRGETDRAMRALFAWLDDRQGSLVRLPIWLPTRKNRAFVRTKRSLDQAFLRAIADQRRGEANGGDHLCARIVGAHERGDGRLNDQAIVDELFTLFLAGYETTGRSLAWALLHAARSPALARDMADEARLEGLSDARSEITSERLARLPKTTKFLSEIMRLYPPAWTVMRDAAEDDVLGGVYVKKGTTILVPIFMTHRHPDFWPDAERFDPERFSPEQNAKRHRASYVPFSLGSRICIGNHFALQEMKLALASLVAPFEFESVGPADPKPVGESLLRPSEPIKLRVRKRK